MFAVCSLLWNKRWYRTTPPFPLSLLEEKWYPPCLFPHWVFSEHAREMLCSRMACIGPAGDPSTDKTEYNLFQASCFSERMVMKKFAVLCFAQSTKALSRFLLELPPLFCKPWHKRCTAGHGLLSVERMAAELNYNCRHTYALQSGDLFPLISLKLDLKALKSGFFKIALLQLVV